MARSVVSLGAHRSDPESRQKYIELIAPGEKPEAQTEMTTMSGCALVVAGIWRRLGVTSNDLDPPYRIGSAISRLIKIANEVGAWMPYTGRTRPGLGGPAIRVGGTREVAPAPSAAPPGPSDVPRALSSPAPATSGGPPPALHWAQKTSGGPP